MSFGDTSSGILMGGIGLLVTAGAIVTIVLFARIAARQESTAGTRAMAVIGIVFLVPFVLAGLVATGCGVIMIH